MNGTQCSTCRQYQTEGCMNGTQCSTCRQYQTEGCMNGTQCSTCRQDQETGAWMAQVGFAALCLSSSSSSSRRRLAASLGFPGRVWATGKEFGDRRTRQTKPVDCSAFSKAGLLCCSLLPLASINIVILVATALGTCVGGGGGRGVHASYQNKERRETGVGLVEEW